MITEKDLSGFTGTENYYKEYMDLLITDGVKFFRDQAKCNWLISDIAVLNKMDKKILKNRASGNNFLIVCLEIQKETKRAKLTIREDTDKPILYKKEYLWTDIGQHFFEKEIKFYLIDNVLLLTSEY